MWRFGKSEDPNLDKNIMQLLDQIVAHPDALRFLEHFDFVEGLVPSPSFPILPLLTSLTLFPNWSHPEDDYEAIERLSYRIAGSKLIRLQLINYHLHPSDIVKCVQTCPSLQYLLVSTCGDWDDSPSPLRPPPQPFGWSSQLNALCMQRKPLKSLCIEHVECWEILTFGVIPTLYLHITSAYREDVEEAFCQDEDIFPHLQKLSLEEKMESRTTCGEQDSNRSMDGLDRISKRRNFIVEYDASYLVYKR
jgi:hypothetical protein